MIRIRIGCPDSNSIRRADENFESAAHTVCRQTTNYAHSLFNKNFGPFVCSWDICLQLHFTCSCTAVARAHTQVPHDNRHWTCKRLPLILFEIRFERKFPIRRSISWKQTSHTHTRTRARATVTDVEDNSVNNAFVQMQSRLLQAKHKYKI